MTGLDLVKEQIRIAAGEPLSVLQDDVRWSGHSIECRINCEDPDKNFQPVLGVVGNYVAPGGPGVRVDSHLMPGYGIPPYYDSLLAKVIVWGATRDEAIDRMQRALGELTVEGLTTTQGFHRKVLANDRFRQGEFNTKLIDEILP